MDKLKKLRNGTYEDQMALFNISTNEVVVTGDSYHDKIYERIEGFLEGLTYAKFDYELEGEDEEIYPKDELFNKCDFTDESYGD